MSDSRLRDFDLIVAIDSKRGIGKDSDLPWDLPSDMAHFVAQSKTAPSGRRNAVIMGRVNWESIPAKYQPLSGRHNVVLTRNDGYSLPEGVARASGFEAALRDLPADVDRVYVIGGGNVYAQAIELEACRRIYLTQINRNFACDVFFPEIAEHFGRVGVFAHGSDFCSGAETSYQIELWERLRA